MRNITKLLALAIAAMAFAAAGCGGGDDTTVTAGVSGATGASGAPLSKSEFITQADAICKQGNAQINQAGKQEFSGGQPSQSELEQFYTDELIPDVQDELDQIRALPAPEGDEDQVNEILDAADQATQKIAADPTSADTAFDQADQLAQDYGLKECGKG